MLHRIVVAVALGAGLFANAAHAASAVSATPAYDHPTQTVTIGGTGFGDGEAVDVYLDTTDTLLLVTSSTGTFSGTVSVPAGETPGAHYVTAIGRHSGDAAQKAITVTSPWTELGYGAASQGWNPYENIIGTNNVSSLGPLWTVSNDYDTGATATVSNGRVFNGTLHGLQALSTTTGAVLWTAVTTAAFYATPAIVGNAVYAATNTNYFYELNALTGATVWSTTLGGGVNSSPVVANGIVYVGCYDNKLYALNASTGAVVWTYTTGAAIDGSPAVYAGVVYIGSEDDYVYALNATTGALLWSYKTSGGVESALLVAEGLVFAASDDGNIYAFRSVGSPINGTSAGTVLWSATGASYQGPAYAQNTLFYGNATFYAVDTRTGKQIWSFTPDTYIRGRAIVANGVVYFTSASGVLYGLNAATGAEIWHTLAGSVYLGGPSIADGVLYVNAFETGTTAYALLAGSNVMRQHAPLPSSLHPDYRLSVTR